MRQGPGRPPKRSRPRDRDRRGRPTPLAARPGRQGGRGRETSGIRKPGDLPATTTRTGRGAPVTGDAPPPGPCPTCEGRHDDPRDARRRRAAARRAAGLPDLPPRRGRRPSQRRARARACTPALAARPCPRAWCCAPVECLSNCARGCSIALRGPGRWTYVYGNLTAADAARGAGRGGALPGDRRRARAVARAAGAFPPQLHRPRPAPRDGPCLTPARHGRARPAGARCPGRATPFRSASNVRPDQAARHRHHRLPRLRQDDADPPPDAESRRPAARRHRQRVRRRRRRRRDPQGLRHPRVPGGEHRRAGQRLHLLHRRRRLHPDHRGADGARSPAGPHPDRDQRPRAAQAAAQGVRLAGDPRRASPSTG